MKEQIKQNLAYRLFYAEREREPGKVCSFRFNNNLFVAYWRAVCMTCKHPTHIPFKNLDETINIIQNTPISNMCDKMSFNATPNPLAISLYLSW